MGQLNFRRQPAVARMLSQAGSRIAAQADANAEAYIRTLRREGFAPCTHDYQVTYGSKRCRCTVWTSSYGAKLAQARSNSLKNSLYAGAGQYF